MTQHSGKSSDFIEVKTNLQMYMLRIILFIKTAVSSNDCLDSGLQALAGLCHGVPVEGPHHLLYLLLFKMFIELLHYYFMTQSQWVHYFMVLK